MVISRFSILLRNWTSSISPKALYSSVLKLEIYVFNTWWKKRHVTSLESVGDSAKEGVNEGATYTFGSFHLTQNLTYLWCMVCSVEMLVLVISGKLVRSLSYPFLGWEWCWCGAPGPLLHKEEKKNMFQCPRLATGPLGANLVAGNPSNVIWLLGLGLTIRRSILYRQWWFSGLRAEARLEETRSAALLPWSAEAWAIPCFQTSFR